MLEAYAHNHIKSLLKQDSFACPHNLTLSRLISRSLRREDKSFIQLEIAEIEKSWLGILVPLCVQTKNVALLLTQNQRRRLLKVELPRLRMEGLCLATWEGSTPPPDYQIWLLDYVDFLNAYQNGHLHSKQLIIPEVELLSSRLRDAMTLKLFSTDWDTLCRAHPSASSAIIQLHERLSRRLFSQVTSTDGTVRMDFSEIFALRDLLGVLGESPFPWPDVLEATSQDWAGWAELDHQLLDWSWHLQPLEPLQQFKKLFQESPFVMLTGSAQNQFLAGQLEDLAHSFDVKAKLGGQMAQLQEPIKLFAPRRQPLPNTEYFPEYLLDQCRRLILGRRGITIIVLDDDQLLRKLTSELAGEFGKRVILESTASETNGVICCHSAWWLNFQAHLPAPEQLILAIIPLPSLESPLTSARVESFKRQGHDWFRDLLLPELLNILPRLVSPIRQNHGRIAILDGRIRSRSWGDKIFRSLEPWILLERLLPD